MRSKCESFFKNFDQELPKIKQGFAKVPESIISLKQFESCWEALFVIAGLTVASAVLAAVLKFALGCVAMLACSIGILCLGVAGYQHFSNQNPTEETKKHVNSLIGVGLFGISITSMITSIPTFLTLGMFGLAGYRSKNLIAKVMPREDDHKNDASSSFDPVAIEEDHKNDASIFSSFGRVAIAIAI
ncbi:MAG: hypothetical protein EBY16_07565 [Gammaproteobacteria bacterium]|nr:hypothetical protein [Gammaproteobacteria bacterium]